MSELAEGDPRHGTQNGYGNHKCRCDACREANRIKHGEYMTRIRESGELAELPNVVHGTSYRYDVGCRCDPCREAHNAKSRATKARLRERNK
ncbi:hypothetical protein [Aeromicrobium sp.]|uniref:hypothetical protein n=1 Tax=Aeromicrobium sp. TaxID=1871063 RepID=UPI00199AEC67|nr:hypothetical protein [Aeromicrobium sp.]MBC7630540.1 hypothetical protein [Aeromicrobium sp.]